MTEFVKKPIVVEAYQWTGENEEEIRAFAGLAILHADETHLLIETATDDEPSQAMVYPGDWVVKDVVGRFYPCKDEVFRATHEEVSPPSEEDAGASATPEDLP
jgi:hypothetical protein